MAVKKKLNIQDFLPKEVSEHANGHEQTAAPTETPTPSSDPSPEALIKALLQNPELKNLIIRELENAETTAQAPEEQPAQPVQETPQNVAPLHARQPLQQVTAPTPVAPVTEQVAQVEPTAAPTEQRPAPKASPIEELSPLNLSLKRKNQEFLEKNVYNPTPGNPEGAVARPKPSDHDIKELYYRVKEHNELFKLGTLFYKDIEFSHKSFGITSIEADIEKEKTILGLAAYFSYHLKNRVTVVTTSFHDAYYNNIGKDFRLHDIHLFDEKLKMIGYSCTGLTIIEFDQLHGLAIKYGYDLYQRIIDFLIKDNELIFWDLPATSVLQEQSEIFFPIINKIDNVSIVVKPNKSKQSEISQSKEFFDKYHLPIKGLIMAPEFNKKGE